MLRSGDTLELWKIWYNMREQDFDGGMMHPWSKHVCVLLMQWISSGQRQVRRPTAACQTPSDVQVTSSLRSLWIILIVLSIWTLITILIDWYSLPLNVLPENWRYFQYTVLGELSFYGFTHCHTWIKEKNKLLDGISHRYRTYYLSVFIHNLNFSNGICR
jgi:hypothetical protein